jgi:glutathione S-transferase
MITLHTWTTPNGRKVSIVLEELGIAYDVNAGPRAARLRMYWTSVMVVAFNQTNQGE